MSISVYQLVTDRIIAELKKGNIPWKKPWTGIRSGAYSRSTGKPYSVLNQMLLMKPGEYLTYKQAQAAGGTIKKGEKSQIVVFWKPLEVSKENDDGSNTKEVIPILKYYNVFHIDQCEGVKPRFSLVLEMNRFGIHDSLIQTATEGKDLTGSGSTTTILSTRHPVHFLRLDGAGKLAQPFFDSVLALFEFVTHVGFLLSDWFRFC